MNPCTCKCILSHILIKSFAAYNKHCNLVWQKVAGQFFTVLGVQHLILGLFKEPLVLYLVNDIKICIYLYILYLWLLHWSVLQLYYLQFYLPQGVMLFFIQPCKTMPVERECSVFSCRTCWGLVSQVTFWVVIYCDVIWNSNTTVKCLVDYCGICVCIAQFGLNLPGIYHF